VLNTTCLLHAQLCQGSLGDPVVKITFGAGPNPGPPLGGVTSYQYVANDCPQDGFYTVRNQTSSCFFFTWTSLQNDHTGDPNGYFMLVNANYQPSDFYVKTVKGLCPGTTFEFAAWIINMNLPGICRGAAIKPNITFSTETTDRNVLQSVNTGDIPASNFPQWKQYGFYFQTPAGDSEVVIRMTNKAPGGCGNDLALDDITFRPCGPDVAVSVDGVAGDTVNVCEGQNNVYTLNSQLSSGYNNPAFKWQFSADSGQTWADISNAYDSIYVKPQTGVGDYEYRVTAAEAGNINNPACRVNSKVIAVDVNPLPKMDVPHNYQLCTNYTFELAASGAQSYRWTGPGNFTSNDSVVIIQNPAISYTGKYFLSATSAKGCTLNDSVNVVVYPAAVAGVSNDTSVCEGSSVQLTGTGGVSYSWSPESGLSSSTIASPIATPSDSTIYLLTVTDANGCVAKDSLMVNIWKAPFADAGPNVKIMEGQFVHLNASAGGTGVYYAWQPVYNINSSTLLQPTVSPAHDTTYTLVVTSAYGCGIATSKVFVRVLEKVFVPNAFSPNGDGINDTWHIEKLNTYPEADLYVFNRYGQAVYKGKGNSKAWNGTFNGRPLPFGTYYYLIDLKNGLPKLSGWVEILY